MWLSCDKNPEIVGNYYTNIGLSLYRPGIGWNQKSLFSGEWVSPAWWLQEEVKPTEEEIIKALYNVAAITEISIGTKMERTFSKEAQAILQLFNK